MANIELEDMSLEDLKQLRTDVSKAIENYETRRRQEAYAAVEAKAREMGFSLGELAGSPKPGKGKAVNPPKYRHPENPAQTWTGRGRQPAWIKEALADGKSLDEFAIA